MIRLKLGKATPTPVCMACSRQASTSPRVRFAPSPTGQYCMFNLSSTIRKKSRAASIFLYNISLGVTAYVSADMASFVKLDQVAV